MAIRTNGVKEAASDLNNVSDAADKVADSASDAGGKAAYLNDVFSKLNLGSIAAAAGVGALVAGISKLTASVTGFAKESVQTFSHFEQIENSLSGMLGDAEKGKAMFEDLRKFSFDTTFGVDTLSSAASTLIQTGTAAEDVKKKLSQLGDVAGGDTNKFNDLVSIFAKIQNTGKASSIQLQQLALRGVPIYKVLKDIGVQGTATAEDISRAFEEMTGATGMFNNNMQSIINTISGKEGFVSDTFREFLASFAEASGIAAVYKAMLDLVYTALQAVVDILGKINESPILQAVFRGVLTAAIVAIGGSLLTSVIPAIARVIASIVTLNGQLTIMNILKGPQGWAVLGVAAAAGIAVAIGAMVKYKLETDEAKKKVKELNDQRKELAKKVEGGEGTVEVQNELKKTELEIERIKLLEQEKNVREEIEKYTSGNGTSMIEKDVAAMEKYRQQIRELKNEQLETGNLPTEEYKKQLEEIYSQAYDEIQDLRVQKMIREEKNIALLEAETQQLNRQKAVYDAMAKQQNAMQALVKTNNGNYESALDLANQLYEKTVDGQKAAIKQQIALLQAASYGKLENVTLPNGMQVTQLKSNDKESQKRLDNALAELRKQYDDAGKTKSGGGGSRVEKELEAWRKIIMDNGKLTRADVAKGNGAEVVDRFVEVAQKLKDSQEKMGVDQNETMQILSDKFNAIWKEMQMSGEFNPEDKSVKELVKKADELGIKLGENTQKLEDNTDELKKQMEDALKKADFATFGNAMMQSNYKEGNVGGTAAGGAISLAGQALNGSTAGSVVQGAAQGFAQGGIIGAIVGVIGSLLDKLERWSEFLEEGEKTLEPLLDILSEFFSPLVDLAHMMTGITQVIGVVFKMLLKLSGISQILKLVGEVFSFIGEKISKFAEWLGRLLGIETEVNEEKQTELEQLKALNEQYSNLFNAILEEEEYYLQKRRELNGEFANENAGLVNSTSVNDMILTPQGKFSTDPNDYIIATKNPASLGHRSDESQFVPKISIVVNNTMAEAATVSVSNNTGDDGQQQLLVTISRKVASDFAEGINGWDNAIASNTARRRGRSIT